MSEEAGLKVFIKSVGEFGCVVRKQKSNMKDNTVFEQENFYYFCQVSGDVGKQHLDTYEAEAGFELQVVSIEDAIKVNKNFIGDDNFDQIMIDRDTRVLELIAYQLKSEQLMKCNEG